MMLKALDLLLAASCKSTPGIRASEFGFVDDLVQVYQGAYTYGTESGTTTRAGIFYSTTRGRFYSYSAVHKAAFEIASGIQRTSSSTGDLNIRCKFLFTLGR